MHRAHQLGVLLLVGTDLGVSLVYPGFSVHDELRLLVDELKLSPLDALRAATVNPARNMRLADTGRAIAAGQRADLVLLDGDPCKTSETQLEFVRSSSTVAFSRAPT